MGLIADPSASRTLPSVQPRSYLLFSSVKNEAPYLLEWVAYHRHIGFNRIVIVSNDCDDGTVELLDALHANGVVEHHSQVVREGFTPQGSAAVLANELELAVSSDWSMWLDADEFLVINTGNGYLGDLLKEIADYDGIMVPWRLFGDGGNESFQGRFISAGFISASRQRNWDNREVKTLFRSGPSIVGFSKVINRPKINGNHSTHPKFVLLMEPRLKWELVEIGGGFQAKSFPEVHGYFRMNTDTSWHKSTITRFVLPWITL